MPKRLFSGRLPRCILGTVLPLLILFSFAPPGLAQWCSCDLPGWSGPLIFDEDYNPKPAFRALSRELGGTGSTRTGLRNLARESLLLGTAIRYRAVLDDSRYTPALVRHFGLVTPESALKFIQVHPDGLPWDPASAVGYDFSQADQLIGLAQANSLAVRGHTLVWHGFLPDWVAAATRDQLTDIFVSHIRTVAGRYRDHRSQDGGKTLVAWDVVNEAVNNDGQLRIYDDLWGKFGGEEAEPAKLEFIRRMFMEAHAADPEAKLFYNDFDCFTNQVKLNKVPALVSWLKNAGAPIHGVGFQTHLTATDIGIGTRIKEVAQALEALGLEMAITEMDVRFQDCAGDEDSQAAVYTEVLSACLEARNCASLTMWGFTDRYTWFDGCN